MTALPLFFCSIFSNWENGGTCRNMQFRHFSKRLLLVWAHRNEVSFRSFISEILVKIMLITSMFTCSRLIPESVRWFSSLVSWLSEHRDFLQTTQWQHLYSRAVTIKIHNLPEHKTTPHRRIQDFFRGGSRTSSSGFVLTADQWRPNCSGHFFKKHGC